VYFVYPETANIRLEDMDKLFGDATTAMPTPQQEAEVEALMSASRSPVPDLDIRRSPGGFTADHAIPGLDINPPDGAARNDDTEEQPAKARPEGIGGWISRMIHRSRSTRPDADAGGYGRVEQEEERDG
jgi:hypothetical protein